MPRPPFPIAFPRSGAWGIFLLVLVLACGGSENPTQPADDDPPGQDDPPAQDDPANPTVQGEPMSAFTGSVRFEGAAGPWIVGGDPDSCPVHYGFVYNRTTEVLSCLELAGFTDPKYSVDPSGVNGDGLVVGHITDQAVETYFPFAVDFSADPGTPILPMLRSGAIGRAEGVTTAGHIVGWMDDGAARMTIWDASGDSVAISGAARSRGLWGHTDPDDGGLPLLIGYDQSQTDPVQTFPFAWDGTPGAVPELMETADYVIAWPRAVGPDGTIYGHGQIGADSLVVIAWADATAVPATVADFEKELRVSGVDEVGNLAVEAGPSSDERTAYCFRPGDDGGLTVLVPAPTRFDVSLQLISEGYVYGISFNSGSLFSDTPTVWDLSEAADGCPVT